MRCPVCVVTRGHGKPKFRSAALPLVIKLMEKQTVEFVYSWLHLKDKRATVVITSESGEGRKGIEEKHVR